MRQRKLCSHHWQLSSCSPYCSFIPTYLIISSCQIWYFTNATDDFSGTWLLEPQEFFSILALLYEKWNFWITCYWTKAWSDCVPKAWKTEGEFHKTLESDVRMLACCVFLQFLLKGKFSVLAKGSLKLILFVENEVTFTSNDPLLELLDKRSQIRWWVLY